MTLFLSIVAYNAQAIVSIVDQKSNTVTDGYVELYPLSRKHTIQTWHGKT